MTDAFRGTPVPAEKFDELLAWLDEPPVANEKLISAFGRLRALEENTGVLGE